MKIKSNVYGNLNLVNYEFIEEHNLCYINTISNKKYGEIDVYENEHGHKYAVIAD